MRPLTKREINSLRYRAPKQREKRKREFRIKKYIVYSPNAITRDFRAPTYFDTQFDAMWFASRVRNCGADVIVEVVNEVVYCTATRFHFPGIVHPTMRTSSVGLCALE